MANYIQKRDAYIRAGFDAGDAIGTQRTADLFAIALNSSDVMGKDTMSVKRIRKVYAKALELAREFAPAFKRGPEQDYYQELFDRRLRQIFPPEDFVPFAERYPDVIKPK